MQVEASYIQTNLIKGEKLYFCTRPHWVVFSPGFLTLLAAVAFTLWASNIHSLRLEIFIRVPVYQVIGWVIFAIAVFRLAAATIFFTTSEYGITNKRIIMKTGWIERKSVEVFLEKLEAINVYQSILGRILDYGTITVVGTGGTQDFYINVPRPLEFRHYVQNQASQVKLSD